MFFRKINVKMAVGLVKQWIFYGRIVSLVLGFIILVLGLNSHYRSKWVSLHFKSERITARAERMHQLCEVHYFYSNCPDIILEQFFVRVISVSFIFSLLILMTYLLWYQRVADFHPLKWLDIGYNSLAAFFLVAGAATYIVSALQSAEFSQGVDYPTFTFKTDEKLVASGLAFVQAFVHISMVALVAKCNNVEPVELQNGDVHLEIISGSQ